jgi:uncharacterized RDD family membrane protein YckC
MARWRDVKQNKQINKNIKYKQNLNDISPISLVVRVKAFIVDSFMITMPVFYFVIYLVMGGGENFSQNKFLGWSIIFILHFIIMMLFWIKKQESPGMRAYELKIVNNNKDTNITIIQYIIRYIFTIISSISIFMIVPFFREDKKTLQDIFSNTTLSISNS